jgi:replicative DNA helicase
MKPTILPNDETAEKTLLGYIIANDKMAEVADLLQPQHFFDERRQTVYRACQEVFKQHGTIDLVVLTDYMANSGDLERVGRSFIPELTQYILDIVVPHPREYARIIKRLAKQRALIATSQNITKAASGIVDEASLKLVEQANREFMDAYGTSDDDADETLREPALAYAEQLMQAQAGPVNDGKIQTSIPSLNRLLTGLVPGHVTVFAGAPLVGKTNLALFLAYETAKKGIPVRIFSVEITDREIMDRFTVTESGVAKEKVASKIMSEAETQRVLDAQERLINLPIRISRGTERPTAFQIRTECERQKRNGGLGLVIVDYLQMLKTEEAKGVSRANALENVAYDLHTTAKTLNVPMIVIASLNRERVKRESGEPRMEDLRDSGGIEYAAQNVVLLHMDREEAERTQRHYQLKVIVPKAREGNLGNFLLTFDREKNRYFEVDPTEQVPDVEPFQTSL